MLEPDVTLTDYALALVCAVSATVLTRTQAIRPRLRIAGIGLFLFFGLSAATGGTVHGFFPDKQSPGCVVLWSLTLLLVGLAACSAWVLGAELSLRGMAGRRLALAAIPQMALFCVLVLLVTQKFWIVFTIYVPAALLLSTGFYRAARRDGCRAAWIGSAGLVVSLLASLIQFLKIGVDPVYFTHNALAHVVQASGLTLIFLGLRSLMTAEGVELRVAPPVGVTPNGELGRR